MKKLSAYLFLFLFGFSAPSFADDIRDFQIEGMSVSDSMLDFLSEEKIKDNIQDFYKNNEFIPVWIEGSYFKSTMYEKIEFNYKNGDKNYVIYNVSGLTFPKNINDCYQKMDEIIESINNAVPNVNKSSKETRNLKKDKSGNSKLTFVEFYFDSGRSQVGCYDWSIEKGWIDHLRVAIALDEFIDWSINN